MIVLAAIVLILYASVTFYLAGKIFIRHQFHFLLYYILLILSTYTIVISLIHSGFLFRPLTFLIQYLKEIILFGSVLFFIISDRTILSKKWSWKPLDIWFILFVLLVLGYLLLPIGPASFLSKAVYTKNVLLMVISYFLGRNVIMSWPQWSRVFKGISYLTLFAAGIIIIEKISGVHLHSLIGFSQYHLDIYDQEPAGPYHLTWTFVASGGQKRFAALFANPLELAASMLLSISMAYYFFTHSRIQSNRRFFLMVLVVAIMTVVFAYSRASFVAVFMMFLVIAVLLRYYGLLVGIATVFVLVLLYLVTLAPRDVQYFVLDTISFRETSSITHAIEWFEAIESIQAYPLGTGLATSGNAGGVESDLKVGGENQFLVYGVQLGVIGLMIYSLIYVTAIFSSARVFRQHEGTLIAGVPLIAAATKAGLFLPLMTANAETYMYVSMITWWMVGYSLQMDKRARIDAK